MSTPEQLTTLARWLEVRAAQLAQEIAAARARRDDDSANREVSDQKDAADEQAQEMVDDAQVERDLAELQEIRLARQRIADDTFGLCIDCGADIGIGRLLAQPAASRCLTCQETAENASNEGAARSSRAPGRS
ncbi:MAG: TraR/DksA family transcriptional regulator [Caldimonas sp.]